MEYATHPFTPQTSKFDVATKQSHFVFVPYAPWNLDLVRLRNEQDILENGLATCVTYLLALRKKLARNERLLNLDPPPTRTKRKKMEQSKRILEREIQNRQRDEQAFFSNLQACKTKMYLTGGLWNQSTDVSNMADCTSSTTQYSYEETAPTEVSWSGWTGSTITSPFEKACSNAIMVKDVAPDELIDGHQYDDLSIRMQPLSLRGHEPTLVVSVSTDCIDGSREDRSSLSPEATVFEPRIDTGKQNQQPKNKQLEFVKREDDLQMRRITVAGMHHSFRDLSLHTRRGCDDEQTQTWCNTTPQQSPRNHTREKTGGRRRSNSL